MSALKKTISVLALLFLIFVSLQKLIVFCDSRILEQPADWAQIASTKTEPLQEILKQLEAGEDQDWIAKGSPILWWHPDEKYKAADPLVTFHEAQLNYREVNSLVPFITEKFLKLGSFEKGLRSVDVGNFSPTDIDTRLFENQGLKAGRAGFELSFPVEKNSGPAYETSPPLFWRLSYSHLFANLQKEDRHSVYVPIEFWYYMNNNPIPYLYFGTHDGDWESFLILFKISDDNIMTQVEPEFVYTSMHGAGAWHCLKDLDYRNGRLQLYSAVNTHATYTNAGTQWRIYPDRTAEGDSWDTSAQLRALVKEPFYGYSGSWGRTSFIHWMNAPIPPGPKFKYLPGASVEAASEQWQNFIKTCN